MKKEDEEDQDERNLMCSAGLDKYFMISSIGGSWLTLKTNL